MSEFAGQEYEFAAGSLFGLRGWDMDELGRLHGVTHREVWRPGENVSTCKQIKRIPCPELQREQDERERALAAKDALGDHRASLADEVTKGRKSKRRQRSTVNVTLRTPPLSCGDPACYYGEHTVREDHGFDADCSCGFWAYDEAGYAPHGTVLGVIEAYGKTTVGTKGFRAQKARIVGLAMGNHSRSVLQRLAHLYPEVVFHADKAELIDAFPGVLRSWPEVGEDFWSKPVKLDEESSWGAMNRQLRALQASINRPLSPYHFGGSV